MFRGQYTDQEPPSDNNQQYESEHTPRDGSEKHQGVNMNDSSQKYQYLYNESESTQHDKEGKFGLLMIMFR